MRTIGVLDRSFVMLPGVGPRTERALWKQGIDDWGAFLRSEKVRGISDKRLRLLKGYAEVICNLDERGMLRELSGFLPVDERWRLLRSWDSRFAAIDIEVVRSGRRFKPVVVSVIRGSEPCRTFVSGDDLGWRRIGDALRGVDFIVTFNGSSFDLPVLADNGFPVEEHLQIDLRGCSSRAGLRGGLKQIEHLLGIERPREMEFSTSEQVSYLWRLWEGRGNKNALDLLIRYNRQDAASLITLAEFVYERLSRQSLGNVRPIRGERRNCIIRDA